MRSALFWVSWATILIVSLRHAILLVKSIELAPGRIGLDYRAFVAGGELVAAGQGELLYRPELPGFQALADTSFVYPPWFAIAMVPWSFLPFEIGLLLWTVFGIAAFVGGLWACGVRDWRFVGLVLCSFPAVLAIGLGQSTFFHVGIVASMISFTVQSSQDAAGMSLATAGWKPHLLGAFGLLALMRPRSWWRVLAGAAVWTLCFFVVSSVVLPGSWRAWIGFLFESIDWLASAAYEASIPGMVALLAGSLSVWRWALVVFLAIFAIPVVVQVGRNGAGDFPHRLALALSVWLLLVPHTVVYDVLLMAIPLGMLIATEFRRDAVVFGTILAAGLSLGPLATVAQLEVFDRAIDLATLSLLICAAAAYFWTLRGLPVLAPLGAPLDAGAPSRGR